MKIRPSSVLQFRLSTCLLAMAVCATSFALAGLWGFLLTALSLLVVGWFRAWISGRAPGSGGILLAILGGSVLVSLVLPGVGSGPPSPRMHCMNNLKQLGLALENYRFSNGVFPPLVVSDKNGKPMHSWRMLLLPYLEEQWFYDAYRFGEPWNGSNNLPLAKHARPRCYVCPSDSTNQVTGAATTNYFAVVPEEEPWGGIRPASAKPSGNRILLIDVQGLGICWTEPKDLSIDRIVARMTSRGDNRLSSAHSPGAVLVLLEDQSVRELPCDLPEKVLREAFTEGFDRLNRRVGQDKVEAMVHRHYQAKHHEYSRSFVLRLTAWIVSVAVLLIHGVLHDGRHRPKGRPSVGDVPAG